MRVAAAEAEQALDAVLPALPGGIHVRPDGETVSLTVYATPGVPAEDELRRLAGSRLIELSRADASDDWRERRRRRYEPVVVAERFLLRPDWAPPAENPDLIEIVLEQSAAFGTGLHPTTALCLEVLQEIAQIAPPDAVLDVGTGSGVLALAALTLGVPRALAIDIDADALRVAASNARLNGLAERLQLTRGGPESIAGTWPLVLANVLAAPLIEMAPALVRRVGHRGQLVLSGIPSSVEPDVDQAYRRLGMHRVNAVSRAGWVALVLRASW